MATIKIEIVAGGVTHTKTKTVSAAHLLRLVAFWKGQYGTNLTDPQAFDAWTDSLLTMFRDQVRRYEQGISVTSDIDFT